MSSGYVNPLSKIKGLVAQRIDQGVDFAGTGQILALGNAKILEANTGNTGWGPPAGAAPGLWLTYQLTDGPNAGDIVYVAEGANPLVKAGQTVTAGQPIANMIAPIETGWAAANGSQPESQTAAAGGITGGDLPAGGTVIGHLFDQLLTSLGVPAAPNAGTPGGGKNPGNFAAPQGGASPSGGGGTTIDASTGITGFGQDLDSMLKGFLVLTQPSTWFRIIALAMGVGILGYGVYTLIGAAK